MADIKNFLYGWCGKKKVIPKYEICSAGNKNGQTYIYEVRVAGYSYPGKGISNSKKDAQRNAAQDFVNYLVQIGEIKSDELPSAAAGQGDYPDEFHSMESVGFDGPFGGPFPPYRTCQPEAGGAPADCNTWYGRSGTNWDHGAHTLESEELDLNPELHGNWTLENSKIRLNQFCQKEKIPAEYKYKEMGPDHSRFYAADMTVHVKQLGRDISARAHGSNKKLAAQSCARSVVRQLFHLGVIEPYTGQKKKEEAAVEPYQVNLSPDVQKQLLGVLEELNIELPHPPQDSSQPVSLNLGKLLHTEPSQRQSHSGVVPWSPPQENWNPWTNSNIDEGPLAFATQGQINADLKNERIYQLEQDKSLQKVLSERNSLPVKKFETDILDAMKIHSVIIIRGAAGCGKTTQVPQYILDEYIRNDRATQCNIVVTQPRRISTVSVAERVAFERGEDVGKSCGYSVRFESVLPRPHASVLFCTAGVLLRKLESGFRGISHVIVDEIHERDINTDILLVVLRDVIQAFPDIRVILMSATIDTSMFCEYFFNCPIIEVHARTFPVQEYYLEDCIEITHFTLPPRNKKRKDKDEEGGGGDKTNCNLICTDDYGPETKRVMSKLSEKETPIELIEALLKYIEALNTPGAVLVFLPCGNLIYTIQKHLEMNPHFGSHRYRILPLHSHISREDQRKVYDPAPDGIIKVILSTNIAETSITINDVVFVIDSCMQKVKLFTAHNNVIHYATIWASKTNLEQRKGRAGRLWPGFCFHLCSRARYERLENRLTPEILQTPLHEVSLSIKLLRLGGIGHFLAKAIEPPPKDAVIEAERTLRELGALDSNDELTPLGRILAKLPIEPRLGKMMIVGSIFYVGDAICTISAATCFPEPFISEGRGLRDVHRNFAGNRFSDHVALLSVFQAWDNARKEGEDAEIRFCEQTYLDMVTLRMTWEAKVLLRDTLVKAGFPEECFLNQVFNNNDPDNNLDVVISLLALGLYPNVCYHKEKRKILTMEGGNALLHKSSVICPISSQDIKYPSPFFVFSDKIRTWATTAKGMTMVSPLQLLLFASMKVISDGKIILLDDWIKLLMPHEDAACVTALRSAMEALIVEVIKEPEIITKVGPVNEKMLNMIRLLSKPSTAGINLTMETTGLGDEPPSKVARFDGGLQNNQGGSFRGGNQGGGFSGGNQGGGFSGGNQGGGFSGGNQGGGFSGGNQGGGFRGGNQGGGFRGGNQVGGFRGGNQVDGFRGGNQGGGFRGGNQGGGFRGGNQGGGFRGGNQGGGFRDGNQGGGFRGGNQGGGFRGGNQGGGFRGGNQGGGFRGGNQGGGFRGGNQGGGFRGGNQGGGFRGGNQGGGFLGRNQGGGFREGNQGGGFSGGNQGGGFSGGNQGGGFRGGNQGSNFIGGNYGGGYQRGGW